MSEIPKPEGIYNWKADLHIRKDPEIINFSRNPQHHRRLRRSYHEKQEQQFADEQMGMVDALKDLWNSVEPKLPRVWHRMTPVEKKLASVLAVVTTATLGYMGIHEFGMWQTRDLKPNKIIKLDPSKIPGYDVEGGTTVTSTPPNLPPLNITIPKK